MEVKIKGIRLDIALIIPLIILLVGYFFLGRYLRILEVDDGFRGSWLAIAILSFLSIYIYPANLGGLAGAFFASVLVFPRLGIIPGIFTLAIATIYTLIALDEQGRQNTPAQLPSLKISEWSIALCTIALTILLSLAISQIPINWIAVGLIGITSGAIATIGTQLKSSELNFRITSNLLGSITLVGMIVGYIQANFTYFRDSAN
jgi:hypothetical protein